MDSLADDEIRLILRAADDIVGQAGRTLLSKVLKGSRERKVLDLHLDHNPAYGSFSHLSLDDIVKKIDLMIQSEYFRIQYTWKMPVLVYTDKGREMERDQCADELLQEWDLWMDNGISVVSMEYLKDRNRRLIRLFLHKVRQTGNPKYIPLLEKWQQIEVKKVRALIVTTILHLRKFE